MQVEVAVVLAVEEEEEMVQGGEDNGKTRMAHTEEET